MIFVRQSTNNSLALGPLRHTTNDTGIIDYAAITWVNVNCACIKGTTGLSAITLTAGANIDTISTLSVSGWAKFTPGSSYFDTLGPLTFKFVSTEFKVASIECMVLAAETYDLLFAASGSTIADLLGTLQTDFTETIAPNVVGGSSMSGSGFLSDSVSRLRQIVEESSINEKYTDADMIRYLKGSMQSVLTDVNANTDHPVVVRWSFPIVADKQVYTLPPNCQKVYRVTKIEDTYGTVEWEILPGSKWDFGSLGFRLEGNSLRLMAKWKTGYTVQVEYVPNGESQPHKGTTATYTTTTMTLDDTPVDGTFDTRPSAFAGYLLRVLSSTDTAAVYTQDRIIASYNNQTKIATVVEAFSPALVGTITYEVLPQYSGLLQDVVCLHAALTLHGLEGASKKYALTKDIYEKRMRALRTQQRKEFRIGPVFENQTTTNARTRPWGGTRGF